MTHLALRFNPLCVDFILVIYCFFLPHRDTNFLVFSIDHTYKVYIGGAQKRPDGNYSQPVLDPNGQVIGQVGEGNRKDIRDAVEAAHKAAPGCVFVHFSFSVIKTLTLSH